MVKYSRYKMEKIVDRCSIMAHHWFASRITRRYIPSSYDPYMGSDPLCLKLPSGSYTIGVYISRYVIFRRLHTDIRG